MTHHSPLTGIHHVSLLARDVTRTAEFYQNVLGLRVFRPAAGAVRADPDRVWLGSSRPCLSISQASGTTSEQLGIGAIHHVALAVGSTKSLLKWKRWLQDHQVLVYGPYDQQAYQDLVFSDPDGVMLEIATLEPGWDETIDPDVVYVPPRESMSPYRDEDRIDLQTWPNPIVALEPDMALQDLHHIATVTSSLDRTDAFYRQDLALRLVRKAIDSDNPDVQRWYWGFDSGRKQTTLAAFPLAPPDEDDMIVHGQVGPGVPSHMALEAGESEMLESWTTALSAAGIAPTLTTDESANPAISLRGPDSETIELVTTNVPFEPVR